MLFEAVRFAMRVAEETDGAFDPTIGSRMAARGFHRHYLDARDERCAGLRRRLVSRRRDRCRRRKTLLLKRPLTLDLGAVAKGLAVDAAARELQPFRDFCIDAGGDLFCGGHNPRGEPWSVGIRHPRRRDELIDTLQISNRAVCTSGDYERGAHLLDPRVGETAHTLASATVIAPTAMLADALATAAFVLGPEQGIALLERMGVEGLLITPALECHRTQAAASHA